MFPLLEKIFTVIFTCEVASKILFLRAKYLRNPLNWLDILVVAAGLMDWLLADMDISSVMDPKVMRLLRLAKLGRGLRMMKMSKVMDNLSLILKCIAASVTTLFWSLILLTLIQCIAAMVLSQLVQTWLVSDGPAMGAKFEVYLYYGTFTRSMLTMFEITMANWAKPCRVLVDNVSEWYTVYFLFYRCVVGFAVMGVITAVFIQSTMNTAAKDAEVMIRRKEIGSSQRGSRPKGFGLHLQSIHRSMPCIALRAIKRITS